MPHTEFDISFNWFIFKDDNWFLNSDNFVRFNTLFNASERIKGIHLMSNTQM